MSDLRVRFAPSPTGYLHVVAPALPCSTGSWPGSWVAPLSCVSRTLTMDVTRESVDAILQGMEWLGLDWDEGPFYQSDSFPLYKEYVQKLLDSGKAYKCYCTAEELGSNAIWQ